MDTLGHVRIRLDELVEVRTQDPGCYSAHEQYEYEVLSGLETSLLAAVN